MRIIKHTHYHFLLMVGLLAACSKQTNVSSQSTAANLQPTSIVSNSPAPTTNAEVVNDIELPEEEMVLTDEDANTPDPNNAFVSWSVLDNQQAGYRFMYPSLAEITYDFGKAEVHMPNNGGTLQIYFRNGEFSIHRVDQGVGDYQLTLLRSAEKLVKDSMELFPATNQPIDTSRFQ